MKDLAIIVVNYNTSHLLERMQSAIKSNYANLSLQIILIDNASNDDVVQFCEKNPEIDFIQSPVNIGFGRANNIALEKVDSELVLLLNTDAFLSQDTLQKSVDYIKKNHTCGVLGVKLTGEDGTLQPSCRFFPTAFNIFLQTAGFAKYFARVKMIDDPKIDYTKVQKCDWVPGCFYLTRTDIVRTIGLFDERFFMYYEEVDHCKRVKEKGWEVHYFPDTKVIHLGGESSKIVGEVTETGKQLNEFQIESELLYFRKHYGLLYVGIHTVLMSVALLFNMMKKTVKRLPGYIVVREVASLKLLWSKFFSTRLGSTPTR